MKRRKSLADALEYLRNSAHVHAVEYEPTSQFPGVDMDAIYRVSAQWIRCDRCRQDILAERWSVTA